MRAMTRMHVAVYRRSGGRLGGRFGAPALVITVIGRKTGRPRTTAVYYMRDGGEYVVVGSNAGDDRVPQWFRNLMASRVATIQIGNALISVSARAASSAERDRLWPRLVAMWPSFDQYQRRTARQIPVAILAPNGGRS